MGSGASVSGKQISLSVDPGQLILFPMIVDEASPQFFVYLGCKALPTYSSVLHGV
jgi:hypothetical protein